MKKKLKLLALLLIVAMLSVMSTSCAALQKVKWTYSDFQRRELTDADKKAYGIPASDYAPYIYVCSVEMQDKTGGESVTKTGTCYFIPYVEWYFAHYFPQPNEKGYRFGTIKAMTSVKEMTIIDGVQYYGKTPYECKNVEMTVLGGNQTTLGRALDTRAQMVFLDGTGKSDSTSVIIGYMNGQQAADEEHADEMHREAGKHLIYTSKEQMPNFEMPNPRVVTAMLYRMRHNNQRLTTCYDVEEGHRFEFALSLSYSKTIKSGAEKDYNCFLKSTFDVHNISTGETDSYAMDWTRIPYPLDASKFQKK